MYLANLDTVKLISQFESFKSNSYTDIRGIWTIGYGTTHLNGRPVTKGMFINDVVANTLLLADLNNAINAIDSYISHLIELNQNEVNALCSLIYNIGEENFLKSSLLKSINRDVIVTEDMFTSWNKALINGKYQVVKGLTDRRKKEFEIYNTEV